MTKPTSGAPPISLPDPLPATLAASNELLIKFWHRILELEKQVRRRDRNIHGPKSARVDIDDIEGEGKEVYEKICQTVDAQREKLGQPAPPGHGGGGRKAPHFAQDERTEQHKITDAQELLCPCCNVNRTPIGFKVSYGLAYVPARYQKIKHVEYTYSCPLCKENVVTAGKPTQPVDKGYPDAGLIAHITQSKFDYHLPLYRQERILLSHGIPIARSTMSRWLKQEADEFKILYKRMQELILQCQVIESDETTMPFIRKGAGKTIKGKISVYRGDMSAPYNLYNFTEDGKGEHHKRFLPGYKGFLLSDGTAVYNQLLANLEEKREGATAANCWAHVYRYFEDAKKAEEHQADYALGVIKSLFKIDSLAVTLPETECVALRQRLSKPLLDDFKLWLDKQQASAAPTSFAEAVQYTLNHWKALCQYIDHGILKMHNNDCENALRSVVLGRATGCLQARPMADRQVKYLNNRLEADHGKLKRLIKPVRGFKSMKTAYATIKGFEVMRMFRKGQLDFWKQLPGIKGEVWLVEKRFGIHNPEYAQEFWKMINDAFEAA
ncbi:MAG: IS66 family transposase [Candidatus Melainabacteria bacterium]|nr:IS66 family transposase [Candidatus Melainabacteria bacterium]